MEYGEHEVPRPLQDEDRWLKLTKRQWIIALPAIVLIFFIVKISIKWNLLAIGIVLSVIILMLAIVLAFFELPAEKYLFGTGVKMERLAMRLAKKKFSKKSKKIYTKNYDNGYKEWVKKL